MEGVGRAHIDPDRVDIFTSLRRPLGVESFGLNQITLQPKQRLRVHRHQQQIEVYVVVHGELTLELDGPDGRGGELITAGPGELVSVPPTVRRQLSNRGSEAAVVLALGASGEHEPRDAEAFADWDDDVPKAPQDVPLPPDLA